MFSEKPWNHEPVLVQIPFQHGQEEALFRFDCFHCWKLGVGRDLVGSTLVSLALLGYYDFDEDDTQNLPDRLDRCHSHFRLWCQASGKSPALHYFSQALFNSPNQRSFSMGKCQRFRLYAADILFAVSRQASYQERLGEGGSPCFFQDHQGDAAICGSVLQHTVLTWFVVVSEVSAPPCDGHAERLQTTSPWICKVGPGSLFAETKTPFYETHCWGHRKPIAFGSSQNFEYFGFFLRTKWRYGRACCSVEPPGECQNSKPPSFWPRVH